MLYYIGSFIQHYWGPGRLLQSYTVLILIALYEGFLLTQLLLPKFYDKLPHDRGREFTLTAEAAKGKPTGAGVVFITLFVVLCFVIIPLNRTQIFIVLLTWFMMLTGYLDDRSLTSWGEYKKGLLDLIISLVASFILMKYCASESEDGFIHFWLPILSDTIIVSPWVFILISTILLWLSINTTNCTDGVDGLSGSLVLVALLTMGAIFYFILGHVDIAAYLLVPHLSDGATWGVITFLLAGILMGYLWHNAYPSKVMMGDAGSRALGFYIGAAVMVSRNPFLILATSSIMFVNGGMGLMKVFLLRFFKIHIFKEVRFPLHDHLRKNHGWSPTQVLMKFLIMQLLITSALVGLFFKVR
ncbi:MAG: phospho-N-acetylmuramoyl-pentapeptide-transferase [Treponema sp.]|jgi:phospho-N-acetylmuramoyl-pentapeptide-transferase|nr:phospho-N-acetylmuramoyl-pentapeptide-transferase [Treponema sp.]